MITMRTNALVALFSKENSFQTDVFIKTIHTPPRWRRGRVFTSHAGDRGSIPCREHAKTDLSRKTGSDSSTAKRWESGVSVTSPRR